MADPVTSSVSSSVVPQQLEVDAASPNTTSAAPEQHNAVESWSGNPAQFETLAAGLDAQWDQVAAVANQKKTALNDFSTHLAGSSEGLAMLRTNSKEEILDGMELQLRAANPRLTDAEVQDLKQKLGSEIHGVIRETTAPALKKAVYEKLQSSAQSFERFAKDPKKVRELAHELANLDSPGMGQDKQAAAQLRKHLGLTEDEVITPKSLSDAMLARANLMRNESERVFSGGDNTLYRSLMLHSEIGPKALKDMGVKPGSWAAGGTEVVNARGEADESAIEYAKQGSAMVLSGVERGLGLHGPASMLTTAAFNVPHLLNAWREVDSAEAGLSAGTVSRRAEAHAERKAWFASAEAGLSTLLAGIEGAHASGHAVPGIEDTTAKQVLGGMGNEAFLGKAVKTVEEHGGH